MATRAGIPNVKSQRNKENTREYFERMLDDAKEDALWQRFMDATNEDTALRAFLRAVEYKRGKPIQPTEVTTASEATMDMGTLPVPDESRKADRPN